MATGARGQGTTQSPSSCESLAKLSLPNTTITLAQVVQPGEFKMPAQQGMGGPPPAAPQAQPGGAPPPTSAIGAPPPPPDTSKMPAFCRVAATIKPSSDSNIKIEVWLPVSGWNGKFYAVGNGGWGGSIQYRGMIEGIEANYATASTDTGHEVPNGSFIPGHPEKFIDYGYRADHEMTLRAKEIINAYLKADPKYSYWIGCSLGGMEALVEADRYPADYDAIIAGAPMNPMSMFNAEQIWPAWLSIKFPDAVIPKEKFAVMHAAILKACATPIGQKQGFLEDPGSCKWDPASLLCKNGDAADCLTAAQVDMAHKLYQGPKNPRTGELIFPGMPMGFEEDYARSGMDHPISVATDLYKYAVYQDPNWDWKTMDFDSDITKARQVVDPVMRAGANLKPFLDRGGKLLLHGGWAEMRNGAELAQYYQDVLKSDPDKSDQVRAFLVPGMGHCGGGNGPNQFDKLTTLDTWVQTNKAPDQIVMSKVANGQVVRTRPTCAWPAVATYKGTGSEDEAGSYVCKKP
jgi:feruloyl esterase